MAQTETSFYPFSNDLPAFGAPPLVEVSISVQFTELAGLDTAHLGLVWRKFRQEFPRVETQPSLGRILEKDRIESPGPVTVELKKSPPLPRMWFLNEAGTRLLQIQGDRFVFNWRKLDTDERYPHYDQVRRDFLRHLDFFTQFLSEEGLGSLEPDQVELTYVNLIPAGDPKGGFSPLENHLRLWAGIPSGAQIPKPELASFQTQLAFREGESLLGRLYIHLESRFLTLDESPVYQLQLIARGAPFAGPEGLHGVLGFLDQAHVWVVQTFATLTTKEMHKEWQRRQ